MSDRATCWSVTINNPIPADDESIALAKQQSGWKVEGQLEKGEEGTPHYQLMVKTPQVRFSALKKAFPRAHIEVARNVKALEAYVHKDDTREGYLPVNDKYPSLTALWSLLDGYITTEQIQIPLDEESRLALFDQFVGLYIELGYHIETMAVNPQIRSCVKKYLLPLIFRAKKIRRQTDRQTDELNVSSSNIQDGEDSETQSLQSQETDETSSCETWSSASCSS